MPTATLSVCSGCLKVNRIDVDFDFPTVPVCGQCKKKLPLRDSINECTEESLKALLAKCTLPLVISFYQPFHGPSDMHSAAFKAVSRQLLGKMVFAEINSETQASTIALFHVDALPTVMIYGGGKHLATHAGAMMAPALLSWINGKFGLQRGP